MSKYYYVYCEGILGVQTNIVDFKWIYGAIAPPVSQGEYEKCVVKFEINLIPESRLKEYFANDRFQAYFWNSTSHMISCRRTIFGKIKIGYNIMLGEDKIVAEVGKNYYRFVKNRVMNLHSVYYLLSDLANVTLLRKGYLTLYASAVSYMPLNKGIVCFGAPNMGKTLTVTNLCKKDGYHLIGEDIVIAEGNRLFACPWTASYRKKKNVFDSAGALGRTTQKVTNEICKTCEVTDLITLTARDELKFDKISFFRQISILNGYLFNYYSTPIIEILGYFDEAYFKEWNNYATAHLRQLLDQCRYHIIQADNPLRYTSLVNDIVTGRNE